MFYFSSEILCSISGFQMNAYNIDFIYNAQRKWVHPLWKVKF